MKKLFVLCIILFFIPSAHSMQPPREGDKVVDWGLNMGAGALGGIYGNKKSFAAQWYELGHNLAYFPVPFSFNLGFYKQFHKENPKDFYFDVTLSFLSLGPSVRLKNKNKYYGFFIGLNVPLYSKNIWDSVPEEEIKPGHQVLFDIFLQTRVSAHAKNETLFSMAVMTKVRWFRYDRYTAKPEPEPKGKVIIDSGKHLIESLKK